MSTRGSNSSNPFGEHMSTEFHLKREAVESAYDSLRKRLYTYAFRGDEISLNMEKGFLNRRGVKEKDTKATVSYTLSRRSGVDPSLSMVVFDEPHANVNDDDGAHDAKLMLKLLIYTRRNTRVIQLIHSCDVNTGIQKHMQLVNANVRPTSYATLLKGDTSKVNFRSLDSDKPINAKAEVKIPNASILDVHSRFGFSLYGYFMGKKVAFPFPSIEGMNGVLENGPWFIQSAPIILKKWTPNVNLLKDDLNSVSIWVKLHYIPIVAFNTDGFSVMVTKLGNPIMLDSYTSFMCLQSWGRMDYARALIDIRANQELKEDMVIAIPNVEDNREVLHTVRMEYEWEPPRCDVCMVFGHEYMLCPKRPVEKPKKQHTNHDGFQHPSSYHEGDELGLNKGSSNSRKKVIQYVAGLAYGSPSNTPLVTRIIELESHMIEGMLVLLDEDGKPLKSSKSMLPSSSNEVSTKVNDLVNEDNDRKWK
ncbi:probable indole-3-pyruvate monooxygenase YUCCA10, partial [Tanacetum coccineum]